jgi:hypothetical protein
MFDSIAVDDADDLVHVCTSPHLYRLQRRSGKRFVDVAHDRPGFVKPEPGMLERRDLAERVSRQVFFDGPPGTKISIGTSS